MNVFKSIDKLGRGVSLNVALSFMLLWLSGCARSSLTLDKGSQQLAPVLGGESEEIQFINHAVFARLAIGEEKVDRKKVGVIAVTLSEIILAEGYVNSITDEKVERIPLSEIEGIALSEPFLHVFYQDDLYVILPYRWFSDMADMEQLGALSELLELHSIPTVASSKIDWTRGIIHDSRGSEIHLAGRSFNSHTDSLNYDLNEGGRYSGDGTPRDSQAFTPWQEWGQADR